MKKIRTDSMNDGSAYSTQKHTALGLAAYRIALEISDSVGPISPPGGCFNRLKALAGAM